MTDPDLERPSTAARLGDTMTPLPGPTPSHENDVFLAPAQAPDELGRLAGYRVLRQLGAGGMGLVFEAEGPARGRRVALKVMRPSLAFLPGARERFQREARAAAAVKDEHVAAVYQVGEERGVPFLVMALLRGESLEDRLRREGRLPVPVALRVIREAALGLAAAHGRGLVHRDVKPANLWLEEGGGRRVKVLDFGLARAAVTGDQTPLTPQGAVLGTLGYLAPEQARGEEVDARCDLFSLGCVLYRALTDKPPFAGKTPAGTLLATLQHEPPSAAAVNPEVPPPLAALLARLLAKRPEDRPPSARALAAALASLEATCGAPRPRPAPTPAARPRGAVAPARSWRGPRETRSQGPSGGPSRRRLALAILAAAAAAASAALLAFAGG
jgi:urea transport system substrate-binding protein